MSSKDTETNQSTAVVKDAKDDEMSDNSMFSGKVVAVLSLVYIAFIYLGGVCFHFMETPQEAITVNKSVATLQSFLGKNS